MIRLTIPLLSVIILAGLLTAQEIGPLPEGETVQPARQDLKIGVVNSEAIMQSYPEFRRAEEQLGREMESWQSERAGWETQMERMQKDIIDREKQIQTGQTSFSEQRKAGLQMVIDSLKIRYQEEISRQMSLEQERFNARRIELLAEVLEVVNQSIEDIGEEQDFDLILDASNGTIVYARNPEDITDILLRRLQDR